MFTIVLSFWLKRNKNSASYDSIAFMRYSELYIGQISQIPFENVVFDLSVSVITTVNLLLLRQ